MSGLVPLPWSTVDGTPCYTVPAPDGHGLGPVGVLADAWEDAQVLAARSVLGAARVWLASGVRVDGGRLRAGAVRLVWALVHVVRVAEMRGKRLERLDPGEAARVEMARVLLGHTEDLFITGNAEAFQMRYVLARLVECLAALVEVAEARGALLAASGSGGGPGGGLRCVKGGRA
ncbi:hypothetical protein RKE29_12550 [Streptomyces sp. B1866]|uniref:hypothetical protein n=1 Tax=Streptomyces sp. B1866 TaxID=3075431 RepID=UPI00288D4757|nr:hypothetical protein [Streptomyces sp. B1866]MDT3397469.1 hypothetical protein [Streptomyces sp. B1866]